MSRLTCNLETLFGYTMWTKSFTHMYCQSIGLLETIFSFSKTMPLYLQYGNELIVIPPRLAFRFLIHLQSTTTGIVEISRHMTCITSQLPHYQIRKHQLVEQWQRIPQGVCGGERGEESQMYTHASSQHEQIVHGMY